MPDETDLAESPAPADPSQLDVDAAGFDDVFSEPDEPEPDLGASDTDWAKASPEQVLAAADRIRVGLPVDPEPEESESSTREQALLVRAAVLASDPNVTPQEILDLEPKASDREVVGWLSPSDAEHLGMDISKPIPIYKDQADEAREFTDFARDNLRALAERQAARQAAMADTVGTPVRGLSSAEIEAMSSADILRLSQMAQSGVRDPYRDDGPMSGSTFSSVARRAFGEEEES